MSLSSGRIVVTKFPSTGYKMLFLSFITLTKGKKKRGKKNKEESESKEETCRNRNEEKGQRGGIHEEGGECNIADSLFIEITFLF